MAATVGDIETREAMADRAFAAVLAALAEQGLEYMSAGVDVLHRCFAAALTVLRSDDELRPLFKRFRPDPVSGRFEELDRAIIRAEQFGIVQFPNPSYTRVRVALSPGDMESLLADLGDRRGVIEEAAREFKRQYTGLAW